MFTDRHCARLQAYKDEKDNDFVLKGAHNREAETVKPSNSDIQLFWRLIEE